MVLILINIKQTVTIREVICSEPFLSGCNSIICRWIYNGSHYADTLEKAKTSCPTGYVLGKLTQSCDPLKNTSYYCNISLTMWIDSNHITYFPNGTYKNYKAATQQLFSHFICQTFFANISKNFDCTFIDNTTITEPISPVITTTPIITTSKSTSIITSSTVTSLRTNVSTMKDIIKISTENSTLTAITSSSKSSNNNLTNWSKWQTYKCDLIKKRKNLKDGTIQIITIKITSLASCDHLDKNYTNIAIDQIEIATNTEINTLNKSLAFKLEQINKIYEKSLKASNGFGWIAVIFLIMIFFVSILNDMARMKKFFSKFKKTNNRKLIKNTISPETIQQSESSRPFRKVLEYEKIIFEKLNLKKF